MSKARSKKGKSKSTKGFQEDGSLHEKAPKRKSDANHFSEQVEFESYRTTRSKHGSRKANGSGISNEALLKKKLVEIEDRTRLVLWCHPVTTLHYFCLECLSLSLGYLTKIRKHYKMALLAFTSVLAIYVTYRIPGHHQMAFENIGKTLWWSAWWVWLGVLSSVGLGTGLHTFLLYLGPHIASVTMAAYSCNSVNFPSPPYPEEILCPEEDPASVPLSIWTIMSKVRLEAFMWGAGTALGELPPYFMARGARLSGCDPDDEELAEFEELQRLKDNPEDMSWLDRTKLSIEKLVEKVGFFGILVCASIPNPLFDLAGITCGHFLVPFWKFFGATLIGKAIVKMHIQKIFVIVAFNEALLERAVEFLAVIPVVGPKFQHPFQSFLETQKLKFRRKLGSPSDHLEGSHLLSWIFEKLILAMIFYFVISIINSFAQSYHKQLKKQKAAKD